MQPLESVKGNSRFRVRNTYSGLCSQIASEQIQFQQVTQGKGNWSTTPNCAFVGVRLVRSISFYVIRYYCPTFLMVCISFVSFWLPTNAWPARIMLTASVLLTLITTSTGAYNEVPAEEATSLVWWLWGMQFFIYLTVAEFAFALAWVQFVNDFKAAKLANKVPNATEKMQLSLNGQFPFNRKVPMVIILARAIASTNAAAIAGPV